MSQDFNIRHTDESLYTDDPIVATDIDLFIQELDVLFSTERFDVLSTPEMWSEVDSLLWTTRFNAEQISSKLTELVKIYCLANELFDWSITAELSRGKTRDIGVITVLIKSFNDNADPRRIRYIYR